MRQIVLLLGNILDASWVCVTPPQCLSRIFIPNFVHITIFDTSFYKSLDTYYDSYSLTYLL
jgi:hypothetical protein